MMLARSSRVQCSVVQQWARRTESLGYGCFLRLHIFEALISTLN